MSQKRNTDADPAPEVPERHDVPETDGGSARQTAGAKERAENFPETPDPEAAQDDLDRAQPGQPSD